MPLNLTKGTSLNLTKAAPAIAVYGIGLSWDAKVAGTAGADRDLDVFAFQMVKDDNGTVKGLDSGTPKAEKNVAYFNNLTTADGALKHSGDVRDGGKTGDDEVITVDTTKIDPRCNLVIVMVDIHDGKARQQNFGQVRNAKARVFDPATGKTLEDANLRAEYDLTEDGSAYSTLQFVELYKHGTDWKFKAVGEGYPAGMEAFGAAYGV